MCKKCLQSFIQNVLEKADSKSTKTKEYFLSQGKKDYKGDKNCNC